MSTHINDDLERKITKKVKSEKTNTNSVDSKDKEKSSSEYPRKLSRKSSAIKVQASIPVERQTVLKWNGWGYLDSRFALNNGMGTFTGNRYSISGKRLPYIKKYFVDKMGITISGEINIESLPYPADSEFPKSRLSEEHIAAIEDLGIAVSTKGIDRLIRSKDQSIYSTFMAKSKNFDSFRVSDAVVWPTCHEEVVKLVQYADKNDLVIIPYGGGTSISNCIECPAGETRPFLSLDTQKMNEILSLDPENMIACVEAGIVGQDLERELNKKGFTSGHDPDSSEFSTLGGWISTRASGMKKNKYGNIEDILLHVRLVTPRGILEKKCQSPRVSSGPDFNHLVVGSEGIFGVITEATIKIRPVPEVVHYGSILFPNFEIGIDFMKEVTVKRLQPASFRLLDHEQFQFGMALRYEASNVAKMVEYAKILLLKNVKGFDPNLMCMATMVYEGDKDEVFSHEKKVNAIAAKYSGIASGSGHGQKGYTMTFFIAYLRDIAMDLNIYCGSMETSVSWEKTKPLIKHMRMTFHKECSQMGIEKSIAMFRVAQTYDAGCCVYFYVACTQPNINMSKLISHFESFMKVEITKMGGSISHHHGIGKLKIMHYEQFVSLPAAQVLRAAKQQLDPGNVFAAGNFLKDLTSTTHNPLSKL